MLRRRRSVAPAPIELIVAAQARGDWDAVTQGVEQHWSSLLWTSRSAMREVVNALPDAVLEAQPRWSAARQYLNFAPDDGRVRPVRFDFEAAQPNEAGALIDDLAELRGRTAHERSHGRFRAAATIAATAIEAIKQAASAELKTLRPLLPGLRIQWATSLLFAGDVREALAEFESAYGDAVEFDSDRMATAAAGSIALIHSVTGDLVSARSWLKRQPTALSGGPDRAGIGAPGFEGGSADAATVMGVLAAANLAIDELKVDEARAWLARDPGDEVAPEQWALRLGVAPRLEVLSGDPLAQSLRNRAAVLARPARLVEHGLNAWALRFSDVGIRIALNDVRGATEALAVLEAGDGEFHRQAALIARVWKLVRAGEHVQAVAVMESVPTEQRSLRVGMELLAAATIIHLRAGAKARAAELFRTLTTMVSEQGSTVCSCASETRTTRRCARAAAFGSPFVSCDGRSRVLPTPTCPPRLRRSGSPSANASSCATCCSPESSTTSPPPNTYRPTRSSRSCGASSRSSASRRATTPSRWGEATRGFGPTWGCRSGWAGASSSGGAA
ncbi:hypothetical protein FHX72_002628 [Pseudoclavibacter helvolus]|uniref:Uncharacterized protein n=1 Tax=Pseudoclavibacter helvolus TaxID=255205 RepID=A0A7W4UR35_9MICO|nr:hypothetical protein [Pseudoclavibacter helvolus]